MKALTLWQPWATLVAIGAKRFETRSWATGYRGPLAIHSSKRFPAEARDLILQEPFATALRGHPLPQGRVVAICELVGVFQVSISALRWVNATFPDEPAFGDWSIGRYVWQLADVYRFEEPIPAKGAQGLWAWESPWEKAVAAVHKAEDQMVLDWMEGRR